MSTMDSIKSRRVSFAIPITTTPTIPHKMLDVVRDIVGARTDSQMAKALGVDPSSISRIRRGGMPASGDFIIKVHEVTGISIKEIKELDALSQTLL